MELAADPKPWTAAVPWARAWRRYRPLAPRPVSTPVARRAAPPPAGPGEGAWQGALDALREARQYRRSLDGEADGWAIAMAEHQVWRAVTRVRLLAQVLELRHGA